MKHALALFVLLASGLFTMLHAQDMPAAKPASPTATPKSAVMPSPVAATKDPVATSVRMLLPRSQKNILGAIEAMPGDKFAFKPTAEQMSFGHLITHIIESNYLEAGSFLARWPRWDWPAAGPTITRPPPCICA